MRATTGWSNRVEKNMEILGDVNKCRKEVKAQLRKSEEPSSMRSGQTDTSESVSSDEEEKGKMNNTWCESLAMEIVKLRATEQSSGQQSQAGETGKATGNDANAAKNATEENTDCMSDWLGAKHAMGF